MCNYNPRGVLWWKGTEHHDIVWGVRKDCPEEVVFELQSEGWVRVLRAVGTQECHIDQPGIQETKVREMIATIRWMLTTYSSRLVFIIGKHQWMLTIQWMPVIVVNIILFLYNSWVFWTTLSVKNYASHLIASKLTNYVSERCPR